ncbi:hypothetical protein SCHPADRAFT_858526 [Schizopora paradoxa]|uniref:PX domain-containing protein n=1 Tax=Schizopora paradoxa TaxID=27342 RepID=A0A0H2RAS6_9AGAM|nr:hypothetical protein SCHPADRAFT_858526 [Schizopora paradoxa]
MHVYDNLNLGTERPPSASAYKRAVYKSAPSKFSVEVLSPQKHGNAFSYGMRICSLSANRDRRSVSSNMSGVSNTSSNSSGSMQEYEVWRRWEDCLYFQELLEENYALMSREKRARLHAGKGVKKNGVYSRDDHEHRLQRAASFESLPPGPDPSMIAKDVHEYLPRLTKKGTLFRASQNTVDVRGHEFRDLIEALVKENDEVPTLIRELRQLGVIRDFFGFWRRDHDRIRKQDRDSESMRSRDSMISVGSTSTTRGSMFGGTFGMYFSASNLSLQLPSTLTAPESPTSGKRVRRPPQLAARLQSSVSPMASPISPTISEPAAMPSESSNHTARPRAYTMQGLGAQEFQRPIASGSRPSRYQTTPLPGSPTNSPPASAPPGASFGQAISDAESRTEEDLDSYPSDSGSTTESYSSSQAGLMGNGLPKTPQSAPPTFRSQSQMQESPTKGKGTLRMLGSPREPQIASSSDSDEQYGESKDDESESQYIIMNGQPYTPTSTFELAPDPLEFSRSNSIRHRLQHFTIEEEDEDEAGVLHERPTPMLPSTARNSVATCMTSSEDDHASSSFRTQSPRPMQRRVNSGGSVQGGMMFTDDLFGEDNMSMYKRDSNSSLAERTDRARSPAAHDEALRVLTSRNDSNFRAASPPARSLTPSARTSGSSSGSSGATRSMEARSSMTSVESVSQLEAKLKSPSSPVLGQAHHIFEEHPQSRSRDSMGSMHSFMSDSFDAFIPPRPGSPQYGAGISPVARLRAEGSELRRSLSAGSRRRRPQRSSQISTLSGPRDIGPDDDEFEDSYLYQGFRSPSVTTLAEDDELRRNSVSDFPDTASIQFSMGSRISSTPSWSKELTPSATPRPISPPLPSAGSRNSMISTGSSSSATPSMAASSVFIGSGAAGSGDDAIAIKAIYQDQPGTVIAFRSDRGVSLEDVRSKLYEKLVKQQGVVGLSENFKLAYRLQTPLSPRAGGGTRSRSGSLTSEVSSFNDSTQLLNISSQNEWRDAVDGTTAKLTLHIMNDEQ